VKSERIRTMLGFMLISTVWGTTWLAIKIGVENAPPLLNAGLRFLVASVVLYALMRAKRLEIPWTPDTRKLFLVMGLMSYSVPFALVYWAEQYVDTGLSCILFAAFPFWVAVFSRLLMNEEKLSAFTLAGVVLGLFGICVIFWGDFRATSVLTGLGMAGIVVSTIMQAFSLVTIKKLGQHVSPIVMNFVGMSIAWVVLLSGSAAVEQWAGAVWTLKGVGSLVYLALVGSVLTFVTYYWLLKRVAPVYLSLTSFINPIVAVLLGAAFRQETLGPSVAFGTSLVLLGILVANGRQLYERFS
jgi:drug/metabolite transporter (DMT)-like permease